MTYHLLYVIRQIKLGTGGCAGQQFCCLLTSQPSQQHDAGRRVPTDMPEPLLHEVVRSGPGSIAECGAGVTSRRVRSSTGSQARLGVAVSFIRQRGQIADGTITEDDLHRCLGALASSQKYSIYKRQKYRYISVYIYTTIQLCTFLPLVVVVVAVVVGALVMLVAVFVGLYWQMNSNSPTSKQSPQIPSSPNMDK